jgi:hypothetical protein
MADAANDGDFVPERHSASAGSLCCDVRCDATLSIQSHFPAFSGIRGGVRFDPKSVVLNDTVNDHEHPYILCRTIRDNSV